MEAGGKGRRAKDAVQGRLELAGLAEGERAPELELAAVDAKGERRRVDLGDDGSFTLDPKLLKKGVTLELGTPGLEEPRRFRYDDFFARIQDDAVYRIPGPAWRGWLRFRECVTGRVRVCRPWRPWLEPFPLAELAPLTRSSSAALAIGSLSPAHVFPGLRRCWPVCQGRVEVFVRTCCCPIVVQPPVIIRDICKIIDCRRLIERPPRWPIPEPDPGPFDLPEPLPEPAGLPEPLPRPGRAEQEMDHGAMYALEDAPEGPGGAIAPALEASVARAVRRAEAAGEDPERIVRLARHLTALVALPAAEQVRYVEAFPELRWWHCTCSTRKVAEVPLQSDGHFDACFSLVPFLRIGCHRRVLYRVSQIIGGQWVVVYDDLATGHSHGLDEDALLEADPRARSCDHPDWPGGRPFAILEQIGNTWADTLVHSTDQDGETSFAGPLAATDGLANAGPATLNTSTPYNQPWATGLALRYGFHPGLQALGITHFRTRVVRVDGNGDPVSEFTVTAPVSWQKYYETPSGDVGVEPVLLNDASLAVEGLCRIPYPDPVWPWLGGQWHVVVDTTELVSGVPRMPNGRYTFVLDLFNNAGQRVVPDSSLEAPGAGDAGTAAFDLRRLVGPIGPPSSTVVVPHKALASLFYVDNLPTYGDIEQILHGATPSATNCQFLAGPADDTVALRYSARQLNGFQWFHRITIKQGLTGPTTTAVESTANVSSGDTPSLSFSSLLGSETKCAFSANLAVLARHTNGFGRVSAYDRYDVAAFALEITAGP
ncbi:MAG: hypothetical protein HZB46_10345 [Solirubrobacterales bacterium]|nr:hypothetical protein [Solirubrobacterales bacterium]